MAVEVRKKENESVSGMLYRFTKKVQQSGVLKEAKKRRFHKRKVSGLKRKLSALHRVEKKHEMERM
ncbi:MAG: 30S ribosomal protein S21, partial [Candidatus Harrisonbacteria bacterium]|nr:30S ribosomal protein S21 [Candidatus Harrisonbacteria bacterium]